MTAASDREVLFLADPWETLDHPRDSTLGLAARRPHGVRCHWGTPGEVVLDANRLFIRTLGTVTDTGLTGPSEIRPLDSFHSVHWRADPPVDLRTLRLWTLLASALPTSGPRFFNPPRALLTWNEKFSPTRFPEWSIPSLVSDSEDAWKTFFDRKAGKKLLVKPSGDAASRGVRFVPEDWAAALPMLRHARQTHGPWLVLQEFDETIFAEGETRVFLLNGKIHGAIRKTPHREQPIIDLDASGAERPELRMVDPTPQQRARAEAVGERLAADGVLLATLDLIGDRILEINVTSPGLVKWMDEQPGRPSRLADEYWKSVFKE